MIDRNNASRPSCPQCGFNDHITALLAILTVSILLNVFLTFYVAVEFISYIKTEVTQNDAE